MSFDFNNEDAQRGQGSFDLIPDNTVAVVVAKMRPGESGDGGWLKATKDRTGLMMDMEFTVDGGDFDRRKLWGYWMTSGDTEGQDKAAKITRSRLRAVLESAHGITPGDDSKKAQEARTVKSWGDFDGIRFCARIGIEKSKDPQYSDKNVIKAAVTPDEDDYIPMSGQAPAKASGGAPAGKKPAWAG